MKVQFCMHTLHTHVMCVFSSSFAKYLCVIFVYRNETWYLFNRISFIDALIPCLYVHTICTQSYNLQIIQSNLVNFNYFFNLLGIVVNNHKGYFEVERLIFNVGIKAFWYTKNFYEGYDPNIKILCRFLIILILCCCIGNLTLPRQFFCCIKFNALLMCNKILKVRNCVFGEGFLTISISLTFKAVPTKSFS